ncbi:MAG: RNA-directed DNA polymerase [Tyzzerella sp.]|nr:RNA-directed DNA polymerase [Tyzzerella sp.]
MSASKKRRIARVERDRQRRAEKKASRMKQHDNLDNIITYENYVQALLKCNQNVSYKRSTQEFNMIAIEQIHEIITRTLNGELPVTNKISKVTINERGKERIITPISYYDRITQRVLCDHALVPVLGNSLIYDNGASTKGKGVDFSRKRLLKHLNQATKEYGVNYYALVFDFKSFFDSISHSVCHSILDKAFTDKRIVNLTVGIIESYLINEIKQEMPDTLEREQLIQSIKEHKASGICLGSQISQVMALSVPSQLDHYIKDVCSFKHYVRYMDDGVVLAQNKFELQRLLDGLQTIASQLGLKFNMKKTRIVPIRKGFTFMKVKYFVTDKGKVVRVLSRCGVTRMRRKLKKFRKLVDEGKMTLDDVYASFQSWVSHSRIAKSYNTRQNMMRLYDELFGGYRITKKYYKMHSNECLQGGDTGEVLQIA